MTSRPDPDNRSLIATIALIVVLSWINGCASVWPVTARGL